MSDYEELTKEKIMALETLKDITHINGHKIIRHKPDTMSWDEFDEMRKDFPIKITDSGNFISFKIQDGPIKENGKNGCQVDELVSTALLIIKGLNNKFPDECNVKAMTSLYEAYSWLQQRKSLREVRGVEGFSKN